MLAAGPNPLTMLLGSLVGCTQYTAGTIAKELKLGSLEAVAWTAAGVGRGATGCSAPSKPFWQNPHKL